MDIASPPPSTTTTTTPTTTSPSTVKSIDLDARIQPTNTQKHLPPPFANGVLKRHNPRNHHNLTPVVVSYKECLRNHAASMGGHAVDGCGEFMPSPMSTPSDPTSLKCAACGCHRNFHRREPDDSFPHNPPPQQIVEYQPHHRYQPPPPPQPQPISLAGARPNSTSPPDSPSPPPISSSYYPSAPHMLLALSGGLSAPQLETQHNLSIPIVAGGSNSNGKKRFRTKFTQDQKEKMHELAERIGWKMQKRDEDVIVRFCNEIGVDRGVFKVWMHNNKTTLGGKKDSVIHQHNDNGFSGSVGYDFLNRNNQDDEQDHHNPHHPHHHQQPENDSMSSGDNVIGTNGSSSSS